MCDCREGTGKTGDKIRKASPDSGKGMVRITRMDVGKLLTQILVSLEAFLTTDQCGGSESRQKTSKSVC